MHFDPTNNISWQLGYRGRVAVFIDGNNLFHAARFHNIDIDYNKLLRVLLGDGRLLRAFFYTGVDVGAERQQGFLLWMRRNGFRVVHKELKTFYDGTRKANLDVEIAVDMLSLAGRYDTAVLVSGDEDFVYAVNAVAYKGCRVEVAGFRSNTAPKLIDVADYFIDLGDIADKVRKEPNHAARYYDQHAHDEHAPAQTFNGQHEQTPPAHSGDAHEGHRPHQRQQQQRDSSNGGSHREAAARTPAHDIAPHPSPDDEERFNTQGDFIRVTDDQ
ncbi:MAG TPA: NYN domain-containing protein [Pyrinomonadaceae bacterium]|nr:NYN domain-containing protein [Pyrinomonadaceae bacterium]